MKEILNHLVSTDTNKIHGKSIGHTANKGENWASSRISTDEHYHVSDISQYKHLNTLFRANDFDMIQVNMKITHLIKYNF